MYQTSFNTTSLSIGKWSLTAEVHAGGDKYHGESSVTIVESQESEKSQNPAFLIISILGISIAAVGLVYWASTELLGRGKKKKRRKKK